MKAAQRAAAIEPIIAGPPPDIAPLRTAFSKMVAGQWELHLPVTLGISLGVRQAQAAKARFIAEMYARACYSMLLLSAKGPWLLRVPVRAAAVLPLSRRVAIGHG